MAAASRYVGDHLRIGLGYNSTDFSDDLTSYDTPGNAWDVTSDRTAATKS